MTTKPLRAPRPLRGLSDFSVRVDGKIGTLMSGKPAALLSEEEAWAAFCIEWAVPFRKVELLRGAVVVAVIEAGLN